MLAATRSPSNQDADVSFSIGSGFSSEMTAGRYNSYVERVSYRVAFAVFCAPCIAFFVGVKASLGECPFNNPNNPKYSSQYIAVIAISVVAFAAVKFLIDFKYKVTALHTPNYGNYASPEGYLQQVRVSASDLTKAKAFTESIFWKLFLFPWEKAKVRSSRQLQTAPQEDYLSTFIGALNISDIKVQTHLDLRKIIHFTFIQYKLLDVTMVSNIDKYVGQAEHTQPLPCTPSTFRFHLLNWLGVCFGYYMHKHCAERAPTSTTYYPISMSEDPLPNIKKLPFDQKFVFYQGVLELFFDKADKDLRAKIFPTPTLEEDILLGYANCNSGTEKAWRTQLWKLLLKDKKDNLKDALDAVFTKLSADWFYLFPADEIFLKHLKWIIEKKEIATENVQALRDFLEVENSQEAYVPNNVRTTQAFIDLGLSAVDTSWKEIGQQYRKLARRFHPDKGGDAEDFKRIQNAYECLQKRKAQREAGSQQLRSKAFQALNKKYPS